jgi:hypothetical protein
MMMTTDMINWPEEKVQKLMGQTIKPGNIMTLGRG